MIIIFINHIIVLTKSFLTRFQCVSSWSSLANVGPFLIGRILGRDLPKVIFWRLLVIPLNSKW